MTDSPYPADSPAAQLARIKVPPHSREAEQAVLGGLMLNNEAWFNITDRLQAGDFYVAGHQKIFEVMAELVELNQPLDAVTLSEALSSREVLETAGGLAYLAELAENTPAADNVPAYADIVRERSVLRQLIGAAHRIADAAFRPEGRASEELLDEAEREVFQIAEGRPKQGGPIGTQELLKRAIEKIDFLYKNQQTVTGLSTGFDRLDEMTAGLQDGDMVVVAARPSMGKCVVEGTRVLDPETGALTPIEDCVARRHAPVLSVGERFRLVPSRASAFVDDGMKPAFRVRLRSGREVSTTWTHPFLTGEGWRALGELQVGEPVAVPREMPVFGDDALPDHEVRLLAYMIGDGGTTQSCPAFTNANPQLRADFIDAAARLPGVACRIVDAGRSAPSVRVGRDDAAVGSRRQLFARDLRAAMQRTGTTGRRLARTLGVSPAAVSQWRTGLAVPGGDNLGRCADLLGLALPDAHGAVARRATNPLTELLQRHGVWGVAATGKVVPDGVFRLPRGLLAQFLNRLFACDGSVFVQRSGQVRVSYASSSERLARDVLHLLARFGVFGKVRRKSIRYAGSRRSAWEVEVLGHADILRFLDHIGIYGKEDRVASARQRLAEIQPRSQLDVLPDSARRRVLRLKGERSWAALFAAAGRTLPTGWNPHLSGASARPLGRARAALFAEVLGDQYLADLAAADLHWDEVVAVEPLGLRRVYDLTVDGTHNFIADDVCVHNTTLSMNLAEHALMDSTREGPVLVFSMEMPAESLMMRSLSSLGRIHAGNIRTGKLSDDDWPRLTSTVNLLKDRPLFIDDTPALSPTEMRARARRVAREHGSLKLVVVDYLQLMQVPGTSENRTGEISEISRSLKALAKEMSCPVLALSQLNRSLEQRPNKRPVMSDLRESGAIEQDADVILFIYRDEVYNEESPDKGVAEIIIGKQRNGPIGSLRLAFLGHLTKFENLADDRYEGYQ